MGRKIQIRNMQMLLLKPVPNGHLLDQNGDRRSQVSAMKSLLKKDSNPSNEYSTFKGFLFLIAG
jgi:hypothetical protein